MLRSKAVILGAEANKKAESGQYYAAIDLFSKAIELFPFDYRFYLNRAFCYEKTELYHLCLVDSEEAIRLNSSIEKCYFRKARALAGLKDYSKAEETYNQILEMNGNCAETKEDLLRMRCAALIDMGFDKETAVRGANHYESIRAAIEGLLAERGINSDLSDHKMDRTFGSFNSFDVTDKHGYSLNTLDTNNGLTTGLSEMGDRYSDKARTWAQLAETQPSTSTAKTMPALLKNSEKLFKPTNIWNYNGLRVENVNIDNKKSITKKFSAFGKVKGVESIRNSKSGVWVYYDNPVSPVEAIARLQGTLHPDISFYLKGQTFPLRLFFAPTNDQPELKFCRPKQPLDNKGECYYWRTTNCSLEDKCPLLHIPVNKHIDAQVWMKAKDGKQV